MNIDFPKEARFQCNMCALCCGNTEKRVRHVLLLKSEVKRISDSLTRSIEGFAVRIRGHEPYVYEMKKTREGKCLFLKENICTVYMLRPLICRFYPFELQTTEDQEYKFTHTEECPGVRKGKRLKKDYFENLLQQAHDQLGKPLLARSIPDPNSETDAIHN
jgi:Fe-S-cluster containining protein